jgi:hypothetical protein
VPAIGISLFPGFFAGVDSGRYLGECTSGRFRPGLACGISRMIKVTRRFA